MELLWDRENKKSDSENQTGTGKQRDTKIYVCRHILRQAVTQKKQTTRHTDRPLDVNLQRQRV